MANHNTGISTTAVFSNGLETFTANWRSISPMSETVEDLEDTHLESTDYYEWVPDDLAQIEAFDIELYWLGGAATRPAVGTTGILTLTFPLTGVQSTAATFVMSGYINRFDTPTLAAGERMIATASWKPDGKTFTFTPGSN